MEGMDGMEDGYDDGDGERDPEYEDLGTDDGLGREEIIMEDQDHGTNRAMRRVSFKQSKTQLCKSVFLRRRGRETRKFGYII